MSADKALLLQLAGFLNKIVQGYVPATVHTKNEALELLDKIGTAIGVEVTPDQ